MPLTRMQVDQAEPTLGQLRQRVRHLRNMLNRSYDAQESGFDRAHETAKQRKVAAAIERAKQLEVQAALELAIAELHAHPDWTG